MKPLDLDVRETTVPVRRRAVSLIAKALLPLAVLAGAVYFFQEMRGSRTEAPTRVARERVWSVETVPAVFGRHQPRLRLYGEVQAGREVALRALVAGEVVGIGRQLGVGALVAAGTPLVEIDRFNYEGAVIEARANLEEARAKIGEIEATFVAEELALDNARAQWELADRDLERAQSLVGRGSLSERSVDDRRLILAQRELSVTQRESNIAVQKARALQQRAAVQRLERRLVEAERSLSNTMLRAPFDGYVTEVNAQRGRVVGTNDAVVTLIARDEIEARFTLSDGQYGRIVAEDGTLVGRPVSVNWYVGDKPIAYTGTIQRIAPRIAASTGGVAVFATLDTSAAFGTIRPGAFVEVLVDDRSYDNVLRVPETALYPNNQIFVVEAGRLASRTVEVVGFSGVDVLVRGALEKGTPIVTTKIAVAGDGLKVRDVRQTAPDAGSEQPNETDGRKPS